ncbi:Uncharacterized protein DAT39_020665 [Clarias magur]|uniref:Uncharacterized protein n=1 Tax=Clarias magur TaxID=1594786 RepID=A0A8J4U2J5_CLAMG|nr:Uncharacterized protein DAT39_020665 [Clarias magur]
MPQYTVRKKRAPTFQRVNSLTQPDINWPLRTLREKKYRQFSIHAYLSISHIATNTYHTPSAHAHTVRAVLIVAYARETENGQKMRE